jgi:hypothetical protein
MAIPLKSKTYTSLIKLDVEISSFEVVQYIDPDTLSFLKDPLTFEYIQDPVIFNNNIYDRKSIETWLTKSKRDPFTNLPVEYVDLIPFHVMRYLLLCLEEDNVNNCLIYHSVPQNPVFAQFLGKNFPLRIIDEPIQREFICKQFSENSLAPYDYMYTPDPQIFVEDQKQKIILQGQTYTNCDLSSILENDIVIPPDVKFVNCFMPLWFEDKNQCTSNIQHFAPVDLLVLCSRTCKLLKKFYITLEGYLCEQDFGVSANIDILGFKLLENKLHLTPNLDCVFLDHPQIFVAKKSKNKIVLFVKTIIGSVVKMSGDKSDTIEMIKSKYYLRKNVPICNQRMIYAGINLSDNLTLSDIGFTDYGTMHLVQTSRGG